MSEALQVACGKIGHTTRDEAMVQRQFIRHKHVTGKQRMNVFRCHRCGLWHIGRDKNSGNGAMRRRRGSF